MARRSRPAPPERPSTGRGIAGCVFGAIMFLVGFGLLLRSWSMGSAAAWPTAQATIEVSGVSEEQRLYRKRGQSAVEYFAQVGYRFQVDGRDYFSEGTHPLHWGSFSSREDAEAKLRPYPVGAVVTIHYRRTDPTEAYLEVGTRSRDTWMALLMTAVGTVFTGAAGWDLWDALRGRERTRRDSRRPQPPVARRRRRRDEDDDYE